MKPLNCTFCWQNPNGFHEMLASEGINHTRTHAIAYTHTQHTLTLIVEQILHFCICSHTWHLTNSRPTVDPFAADMNIIKLTQLHGFDNREGKKQKFNTEHRGTGANYSHLQLRILWNVTSPVCRGYETRKRLDLCEKNETESSCVTW